ncbi:MAG: hypothetical protein WC156_05440 [Pedobacter sp.]
MEIIDNITTLLGDNLKNTLRPDSKLKIAASCFSIYAYEALKAELEKIDSLNFIFTSPTFISNQITDKLEKEKREFHIPKLKRETSLYGSERNVNDISRRAQGVFNVWAKLPPEERTPAAILNVLDFDFFEMLDSVTIARSRKHIQKFYDMKDIGPFPQRLKPISYHSPLTNRTDVINFNEIFNRLVVLNMAVYAPFRYILASRLSKYEAVYDTEVKGGLSRLKQSDREKSLQALMTVNLLKRLESSVEAFRLTLGMMQEKLEKTLATIEKFNASGVDESFDDLSAAFENADEDDMEIPDSDDASIGGKIKISLADMDLDSWKLDLSNDLEIFIELLAEMRKITPPDDAKLQHLKELIADKQKEPINPGNKKILIFTAFADTAAYLYNNLTFPDPAGNRLGTLYQRVDHFCPGFGVAELLLG